MEKLEAMSSSLDRSPTMFRAANMNVPGSSSQTGSTPMTTGHLHVYEHTSLMPKHSSGYTEDVVEDEDIEMTSAEDFKWENPNPNNFANVDLSGYDFVPFRIFSPTDGTSTTSDDPVKTKKKQGRPPKPENEKKRKRADGPTKLNKRRKVKNYVNNDVWSEILKYVEPKQLFELKFVSRDFHYNINRTTAWRESRQNTYPDLPPPPPGLSEENYMNLLELSGCMGCGNKTARKVYWAFLQRWCARCAKPIHKDSSGQVICKTEAHRVGPVMDPRLLECIPMAVADSYERYDRAGNDVSNAFRNGHGHKFFYREEDMAKITVEFKAFQDAEVASLSTEEEKDEKKAEWIEERKAANKAFLDHVRGIEEWERKARQQKEATNRATKQDRVQTFKDRIKKEIPHLTDAALELIPEYVTASKATKPPTDRQWTRLRQIIASRAFEAEHEVDRCSEEQKVKWRIANESRRSGNHPKHVNANNFIMGRSQSILSEWMANERHKEGWDQGNPRQNPDFLADTIIRAFQYLYARLHDEIRANLNILENPFPPELLPGHFPLTLEHAKEIFENRLCQSEWFPNLSGDTKIFRCPGCRRKDINEIFSFQDVLRHIMNTHAKTLGDFVELREAKDFSGYWGCWLSVPWHFNLPMIGRQHSATGQWRADDVNWYPEIVSGAKAPKPKPTKKGSKVRSESADPTSSEAVSKSGTPSGDVAMDTIPSY